jgi:photosynthetic reaction center cytochrome c subunit
MADFKWFAKWNRDNPKDILGPAYVVGAVGGAIVVAALVITWGYPAKTVSVQTGPRGTGMEVVKFASDLADGDADAAAFFTEPAIVPAGGEALARDVYENVQVLGDLTEDNFNRLMLAMTEWVSPEQSCAYCHGEEGDFASDALYTKVVSRRMIEMTRAINEGWSDHVAPAGVTCFTCHRGENVPVGIWFDISPVVESMTGWSGNQNRVTSLSQSTSLPSDALQKYLVEYEPIRVHDLEPRVDNEGTASIQDTERTFSLMNYFSNSLGTNCTYCHNTRALHDLDEATPQLLQSQLGIGMALELNNDYLLPLGEVLPASRLGAMHQDVPKVACATCHKGYSKPLEGLNVIADWPELTTSGAPVYE